MKLFFLITLCTFLPFFVHAEEQVMPNTITHGPYLCNMDSEGVTIVWKTSRPSLSWVEAAPAGDGHFYKAERPSFFQTLHGKKLVDRTLHAVRVKGLSPDTKYLYRIFSKDAEYLSKTGWLKYGKPVATAVNEKYSFTTFSREDKDITFLMLNDIHGKSEFMKELCGDLDFNKINFVVFNGDMASWITSEEELFSDFMDASVSLFATRVPIMFTRGNHETRGQFSHKLHDYFPTTSGTFYQVYYGGGVCFLVLDCGEDKPDTDYEYSGTADYDAYREEEAKWLEKIIATEEFKKARVRIVFLHIPPTQGDWHGNHHLRKTLMPLLNNAGIDLMLSGHTHRHSFHKADDNAAFPILVNGNNTYALGTVSNDSIKMEVVGKEASQNHTHLIKLDKTDE